MKPRSATDLRVNLVGLACLAIAATAVVAWRVPVRTAVPLLMAATGLPILLLDALVHRVHLRPSTGLDFAIRRRIDWVRVGRKWLGGLAMIGAVAGFYFFAPEYQGSFYDDWYAFLRWAVPAALAFGAAYFAWLDRYLVEPEDAYWHVGAFLTGAADRVDGEKVADLARTWAIKGFFAALMYVYAGQNLGALEKALSEDRSWFVHAYDVVYQASFLVDVVFTTMGYLLTLRVFDTQVRSAEPTALGWVVALVCYQPFFSLIGNQYLKYEGGYYWDQWLAPYPPLQIAWGSAALALTMLFALCTVTFGCRFSNLTSRGILTNGPYAWMRHPAYFSKCASYWLMFVPFVYNGSWYEVARDCVWLSALCVVYWLRARTEERHLSRDPDYVRYALHMNDHSVFAWVGRLLPFTRYQPPAAP